MRVTLRIKRVYFDAIERGEKTYELREHKEYYSKLFDDKNVTELLLHFQGKKRLVVAVKSIRLINTPSTSTLMLTKKCYKISLGKILRKEHL